MLSQHHPVSCLKGGHDMPTRQWSRHNPDSSMGRPNFVADFGLWDDEQAAAAEDIASQLQDIDLVRLVFCDPHGLARSKTLAADPFRRALRNGMDFSPGPFIFDTGHAVAVDFLASDPGIGVAEVVGAGDFVVVPDPLTFQVLPFLEPRTAWVLGDEFLRDGSPHPISARHVLRRMCSEYARRRYVPIVGLEVEWYLTRLLDGAGCAGNGFGQQGTAPKVEAMNAGYQFNLDSFSDSVATVTGPLSMMLIDLGLPLRTFEHESGPGQIEITFDPMSALDAADAMLLFRTLVKQTCSRRGFHASFMALPHLESFDPSGWHIHQSVAHAETGRNVFAEDGGEGLSAEGKAYVEGLMARARDLCLLSVPTVNGYRRLRPEFALSPTRIGWSYEDRTAMIRLLGVGSATHLEHRVAEPCANPYLAIASQLYAGLDGITTLFADSSPDRSVAPADSPASSEPGPAATLLPTTLRESLDVFSDSSHPAMLLGGPLFSCIQRLKQSELARFEAWCTDRSPDFTQVTEWEEREYFDVY